MANTGSTSKQTKKSKRKGTKNSSPELHIKVDFTPFEKLKTKTRDKLRSVRSITVAMLPVVANEQDFQDLQFVKLSTSDASVPALLILDSSIKKNASIISENNFSSVCFREGEDMIISSCCPRLLAEEVSLLPVSNNAVIDFTSFTQFLKQQLIQHNFVIQTGNYIVLQYLSQDVILKVYSIKNFASDMINCQMPSECIWQTQISLESQKVVIDQNAKHEISFDDIGGYKLEIENLKQEVGRLFCKEKSSVKAVKGILISGPSGCGKSLIGEALKNEYKNKCISINLEVIKSKFQGETEMNLKQHFMRAASRAPCLVFIDDLDLLCSNRDRGDNSGVITALLHLIDGLGPTTSDGILVIATATKPQTLDVALRRPGRLSHDLFILPPEESDREAILQKMLQRVPHDVSKLEIETIASNTRGYVGGDLHNVMLEAVMHSEGRSLTKQDLDHAIAVVKPVALKGTSAVDQKVTLSDICGYDTVKIKLQESLNLSLNHSHMFEQCGLTTPTQYLLFGPPGCGKSSIIMALAAEFHLSIIRIKRSTVLGKYFGESEQNLAKLFSQAQESSPCILHFENFEGLAGRSNPEDGGSDVEGRIINHLKVQLDGIVRNERVFIFAETNRPDLLNKDVIRPGRFHEYYLINLPEAEDRLIILNKQLLPASFSDDFSMELLVEQTEGFTVAEILQVCNEMKQLCRREEEPPHFTAASIEEAFEMISPSTSKKMLQKQIKFASIYCSS